MLYRDQIQKAIGYLRRIQNADGGIPATKPGDVSGCWTTAEAIEAVFMSPYRHPDTSQFLNRMVYFLEQSALTTSPGIVGWPLVSGGAHCSTMTTGHVVAALAQLGDHPFANRSLVQRLSRLGDQGVAWLNENQNGDGGWGVEPTAGPEGKLSRVIATVYALRAYGSRGETPNSSSRVRRAVEWLTQLQGSNGGFSAQLGGSPDVGSTARVVAALLRVNALTPKDRSLLRAWSYVMGSRPRGRLWELATETYVTPAAPGQTIYNSNTPADVAETLIRMRRGRRQLDRLLRWYVQSQEEDGKWYLAANKMKKRDIATWPTNEGIYTLALADHEYSSLLISRTLRRLGHYRRTMLALLILCGLQTVWIVGLPTALSSQWTRLPERYRDLLVGGVFIALIIEIVGSFLYEWIRSKRANKQF
ncbi:MAG TPA: prenyltransferase/squalene oxidase repeat-containing protein [Longimicrobium sp.]